MPRGQYNRKPQSMSETATEPAAPEVVDFKKSPEFAAAVAAATAEVVKQLGAQNPGNADLSFIRELAAGIAELSDQGTGRKRVAPEILAKRETARERMIELIVKARHDDQIPEYKLVNETYLGERLLKPFTTRDDKSVVPTEIKWRAVPNECMRPINDVATAIFTEFVKSIGGSSSLISSSPAPHFWVTQGGLVVKGEAPAQRREVGAPAQAIPDPFADELQVKAAIDPASEFINVLGTIQAPARQNYLPGQH